MSQTPFISNDAIPIDTPVSTLELLEPCGKEIEIRNLTEPISVFLSANQSEISDLSNMTGVISSSDNMTFYKIEHGEYYSLFFTISCTGMMKPGETLAVIGKRNSRPSTRNSDLSWSLTSCNTTLKELLSRKYLNNSGAFYVGVKLLDVGNVTNGTTVTSEVKFSVSVKAVGCYYWNENVQAWSSGGCEVKLFFSTYRRVYNHVEVAVNVTETIKHRSGKIRLFRQKYVAQGRHLNW